MSINFSTALGIHEQALLLRGKRTEVLASNIANVDTPGYKARDFDFRSVLQARVGVLGGDSGGGMLRLSTAHAHHLGGFSDSAGDDILSYRVVSQASADGNSVDEQLENAAFARNALEHQASFEFLNRKFLGLMKALKGE
ncbi:MAG: flagellar basal body rod protein FlgB [Gammaproteobacteria bacterium]|nr:flagellar basal body rod protein FlgB [Gammaproteobacteria bacterium]MDP2139344.1 flagellar basal body rod protein FlgB [Gammaproteobacteria bacterium]MDP2346901.1 flagellar basal body rod protein FlgB [Gammaproteobacteria bacterium]